MFLFFFKIAQKLPVMGLMERSTNKLSSSSSPQITKLMNLDTYSFQRLDKHAATVAYHRTLKNNSITVLALWFHLTHSIIKNIRDFGLSRLDIEYEDRVSATISHLIQSLQGFNKSIITGVEPGEIGRHSLHVLKHTVTLLYKQVMTCKDMWSSWPTIK